MSVIPYYNILNSMLRDFMAYVSRVAADSGLIKSNDITRAYFNHLRNTGQPQPLFSWFGDAGYRLRKTDNRFVNKIYSAFGVDAVQTTDTSQPYVTGLIEGGKLGLKNNNGDTRFMTHTPISFGANESWSVTTVLNRFGSSVTDTIYGNRQAYTGLYVELNHFSFYHNTGAYVRFSELSSKYIGKNLCLTFVYNGTTLSMYINGAFIESKTITFSFIVKDLLLAHVDGAYTTKCKLYAHIIRSQALTPTQVTANYNFFKSNGYLGYEGTGISGVKIGNDVWSNVNCEMVATPQGNLIPNITLDSNVEKITNIADREFSSDTSWWSKDRATIGGGIATINDANGSIFSGAILTENKWYKATFTVSGLAGGLCGISGTTTTEGRLLYANGNFTIFFLTNGATPTLFRLSSTILGVSFDNISVQEIGWSGSQELYDGIYAQTSGTTEQKTYAAVKAAAMWCYYSNDVALGSIYGKLYNWYAVKLLQMDIDYYNAANPSIPWGWRVPTITDYDNLAIALGGASVAGGKMKVTGISYWNSPNTGADNSSGFSSIPSGRRSDSGSFALLNDTHEMRVLENNKIYFNRTSDAYFGYNALSAQTGASLRLIKV